jgi:hypothetical protein
MPKFKLHTLLALVAVAAVLCSISRFLLPNPAYLYALHLEGQWTRARPKTMAQFESHLSLYSKRGVQPSASGWAPDYKLKDGEKMVQYTILGAADMEVVYDKYDNVVTIITSYE